MMVILPKIAAIGIKMKSKVKGFIAITTSTTTTITVEQ